MWTGNQVEMPRSITNPSSGGPQLEAELWTRIPKFRSTANLLPLVAARQSSMHEMLGR
jgi:hypothetical protein